MKSHGQNLLKGFNNLLRDIEEGDGQLRVKMTDTSAFELGSNVATTPGKVVFQNELIQLLQFNPTTEQQYERPLLIIPPWINKYYILDLREKNSFIKWATDQGHTVFVISWVNPDAKLAEKSFDDYMTEGALAAIDAVCAADRRERTSTSSATASAARCSAATLAYMAAKKDKRIASATFFVALIDFSMPGELGVFIDEQQVASLEKKMEERGYLEGSEMAGTFNMLRANDLIWSFVVNNYLMGKEPFPFDLLYWNSDSTRMPYKMHSFYLRNMYIEQPAARNRAASTLLGVPIDLAKIKMPTYFISTVEDHIAPWKSTYLGATRCSAGRCASSSAAPATSPASSIRRRPTSTATGPTTASPARRRRRLVRRRRAAPGFLVDRLAAMGDGLERRRNGAGARSGQGQAEGARGRAGILRQASPRRRAARGVVGREHRRQGGIKRKRRGGFRAVEEGPPPVPLGRHPEH